MGALFIFPSVDIGDSEGVLRKNASTTLKICQLVTSVMLAQLI